MSPPLWRLYLRGAISNSLGGAILVGVGRSLGLSHHTLLAFSVQLAVFLVHGLPFRSEKFYDLSGSATHFAVVAYALCSPARQRSPRQLLSALFSLVWMVRLGTFLFLRISRDGKDGRFDAFKPCWLTFLGAWTIQACWVSLIQLPVLLLNTRDDAAPAGPLDAAALALWLACFLLEAAADNQKFTFRSDPANKERFITTGVWALSRHPNYCGEIGMWTAQALAATSAFLSTGDAQLLGAWGSPLFTAFLLLRVAEPSRSVPLPQPRALSLAHTLVRAAGIRCANGGPRRREEVGLRPSLPPLCGQHKLPPAKLPEDDAVAAGEGRVAVRARVTAHRASVTAERSHLETRRSTLYTRDW